VREHPYTRLKKIASEYCRKIRDRKDSYWHYHKKESLSNNLDMHALYYSTRTAYELGYETHLRATEKGLEIHHVEKLPDSPFELLY